MKTFDYLEVEGCTKIDGRLTSISLRQFAPFCLSNDAATYGFDVCLKDGEVLVYLVNKQTENGIFRYVKAGEPMKTALDGAVKKLCDRVQSGSVELDAGFRQELAESLDRLFA